jgi:hypothetical protein
MRTHVLFIKTWIEFQSSTEEYRTHEQWKNALCFGHELFVCSADSLTRIISTNNSNLVTNGSVSKLRQVYKKNLCDYFIVQRCYDDACDALLDEPALDSYANNVKAMYMLARFSVDVMDVQRPRESVKRVIKFASSVLTQGENPVDEPLLNWLSSLRNA